MYVIIKIHQGNKYSKSKNPIVILIKVIRIFIVLFVYLLSKEVRNNAIYSFIYFLLSLKLQS